MKYARLDRGQGPEWARLEGDQAVLLTTAPWQAGSHESGSRLPLASARLLTPAEPTKIICVGRNYAEHAKEMNAELPKEPLLFLKPPSALLAPGGDIVFPPQSQHLSYEGELAVVIGTTCKDATPADVMSCVFGYTCGNDVTARDIQRADGQWTRGKGFDTFCPTGPYLVTDLAWEDLRIQTRVNGEVRQDGRTSAMVFSVPVLLSYISQAMTLEPGDLVLTGTPPGVGSMNVGDRVEIEIEGIGRLENSVRRK
ncbi:MAG: fumarylacetoacetate hydrolase family protein [Symbiobacteriia bacterium]